VLPHIIVAQACLSHLLDSEESSYNIIDGRMGEECLKVDEALLCIANAAVFGIAAALRAELKAARVNARFNELRIGAVIRRDAATDNPAFPGWRSYPASQLASVLVSEMQGERREDVVHIEEEDIARAPREEQHEMGREVIGERRVSTVGVKAVPATAVVVGGGPAEVTTGKFRERAGGEARREM
jgi:hypothetical protein